MYKHTFYYFLGNKKYPEIYILPFKFSGEVRQAPQVDPLPAPGRDPRLRHPQATHDRAGPQVEVPVQDPPQVLVRVPARTARVLEARQPQGKFEMVHC